jgi:hypothetical protein
MTIKLKYESSADVMREHVHGFAPKDLIVLHETVSGDIPGWTDIHNVDNFLASKDYGVHSRSIGIEQVSDLMLRSPLNAVRRALWVAREPQLRATAKLLACISRAHNIPLVYSNGLVPGVTSHWDVSQHFAASEGHTDCWPVKKGGYYPIGEVITLARGYKLAGFAF